MVSNAYATSHVSIKNSDDKNSEHAALASTVALLITSPAFLKETFDRGQKRKQNTAARKLRAESIERNTNEIVETGVQEATRAKSPDFNILTEEAIGIMSSDLDAEAPSPFQIIQDEYAYFAGFFPKIGTVFSAKLGDHTITLSEAEIALGLLVLSKMERASLVNPKDLFPSSERPLSLRLSKIHEKTFPFLITQLSLLLSVPIWLPHNEFISWTVGVGRKKVRTMWAVAKIMATCPVCVWEKESFKVIATYYQFSKYVGDRFYKQVNKLRRTYLAVCIASNSHPLRCRWTN